MSPFRLVNTKSDSGKLFVNKLAAAERQLSAAIRLYFLEEDKLAIHTIGHAAYTIYFDLLRGRGRNGATVTAEIGVLYLAYDFSKGRISEEDCAKAGLVGDLFKYLTEIFLENPSLHPKDADVHGLDTLVKRLGDVEVDLKKLRNPANYLKHADRDPFELIDVAKFETEEILIRAIDLSFHMNAPYTQEKDFFYASMFALGKMKDPPIDNPTVAWLIECNREEVMALGRLNLCRTP